MQNLIQFITLTAEGRVNTEDSQSFHTKREKQEFCEENLVKC